MIIIKNLDFKKTVIYYLSGQIYFVALTLPASPLPLSLYFVRIIQKSVIE